MKPRVGEGWRTIGGSHTRVLGTSANRCARCSGRRSFLVTMPTTCNPPRTREGSGVRNKRAREKGQSVRRQKKGKRLAEPANSHPITCKSALAHSGMPPELNLTPSTITTTNLLGIKVGLQQYTKSYQYTLTCRIITITLGDNITHPFGTIF